MSRTFDSLKYPNFRLWFGCNMVSATGTWMQRIAQDWVVLTVLSDNSGAQLGIVTALQFVPLLLLSPWAGVVADRMNRRVLLQATQLAMGIVGLILGVLILTGTAQLWHVYFLALAGGIVQTLDSPARQAFVSEMVPAESLTNAVGLNSTAFNIARLIGPGVSGVVIEWIGPGWVFIVNAVTFAATVTALGVMKKDQLVPRPPVPRKGGQVSEGLRYVRNRPDIVLIMTVMCIVSAFGMNYQVTSALMATEVFHKQADGYGVLGSTMAIGALGGALLAARRRTPRLRIILIAGAAFSCVQILQAVVPSYWGFAVLAVPLGLAMLTMMTCANTAVQVTTDPTMRGRVMALYMMIFLGSTPIGSPIIGWVGEAFGARWAVAIGGIISLITCVLAGLWARSHWQIRVHFHWSLHPLDVEGPVERAQAAAEAAEASRRAQEGD